MQAMLASLSQIQGVTGAAVFGPTGECILHQMPVPYEPILLNRLFADLRTVLDAFRYMDDSGVTDSFVCRFDNGNLILRPIGANSVLLITASNVNMAMVNVGFKVAALKLERNAEAERAASFNPPAPQPAMPPQARVTVSSVPAAAPTGTSVSALTVSSVVDDAPIPPDAVGARIADDLVKLLAVQVGPFAKVLFKQELKRIGATVQTLTRSQLDDLITLLAPKVPDPTGRNQFIAAAKRLVTKA
jgi:predicted regulator of Ras-like GTPase activity (Roadblock/LC7/MglB family)